MGLAENAKRAIDGMGQVELSGVKLETADPNLLDVGSLDLDRHVAMQPAAIAYYGAMKKEASRRLDMLKRSFDRWRQRQWAMAKAAVLSGSTQTYKPTLADIESRFITDNEPELEKWDAKLDKAQEEFDTLDAWYEAWRQKSFSLRDHVSVNEDEKFNSNPTMTRENGERPISGSKMASIRSIIERRKQQRPV